MTTTVTETLTTGRRRNAGPSKPSKRKSLHRTEARGAWVLISPYALLFLDGTARTTLLLVVWGAAVAGVIFRVFWTDAPRWLYTPMYLALGWAAVFFIPQFLEGADKFSSGIAIATLVLVAVGGLLYTVGGVVYGLKRPDPSPRWFGFHEVFHSFTVLAFAAHYVGISMATYSLR